MDVCYLMISAIDTWDTAELEDEMAFRSAYVEEVLTEE